MVNVVIFKKKADTKVEVQSHDKLRKDDDHDSNDQKVNDDNLDDRKSWLLLDEQKIGNLCFSVTELNMYLLGSEAVVQRCS